MLKIAQQKFIGLVRSDKNGEVYWKFKDFYEAGLEPTKTTASSVPNQSTSPTPQPSGESEPVNLPSTEQNPEESEQVKKFREKYGTAENPAH